MTERLIAVANGEVMGCLTRYKPGRLARACAGSAKSRLLGEVTMSEHRSQGPTFRHTPTCGLLVAIILLISCLPAAAQSGSAASFPALREAALRAAKGKRSKPGVAAFLANLETEVLRLERDLRRRLAGPRTLDLADTIIDGANPQEPVHLYFPGDDLFAPFERRRGLPIGNLTSQFFANAYLDGFDHFCKEVLRAKGYLRYVDDFALFHDAPGVLADWQRRIDRYLEGRRLKLHPRKTYITETSAPASFLGYVLLPGGRRRLPEDNVRRFRNRLRGLRDRWRAGTVTRAEIEQRINSWIAHASHAHTWRLRHSIFRAGWFDPAGEPGHPPAVGSSAAVPGTTTRGTSAPRTGTGTPPTTGTGTTVSVLPARSPAGTGGLTGPPGAPASVQGWS